jgi:heme-degrading monooxygenase HmoA
MIARIWHGMTPVAKAEAYLDYLNRTGVTDCRATEGNRGVVVSRRIEDDVAHFLFVSLWETEDAIKRFAGADAAKARYYPEDEAFLLELEPVVQHYEVLIH